MKKPFIVANVREVLDLYDKEEISFSRMVEMLNEIAEKFYELKEYDIDFSGNVLCRVSCNGLKVTAAMNGYGDGIRVEDILITPLPATEQNSFDEGDRPY